MLDLNAGYYLENKETGLLSQILGRAGKNYLLFTANDKVNGMNERERYTPVEMIRLLKSGNYNVLHITADYVHLVAKIPYLRIGQLCKAIDNVEGELLASRADQ